VLLIESCSPHTNFCARRCSTVGADVMILLTNSTSFLRGGGGCHGAVGTELFGGRLAVVACSCRASVVRATLFAANGKDSYTLAPRWRSTSTEAVHKHRSARGPQAQERGHKHRSQVHKHISEVHKHRSQVHKHRSEAHTHRSQVHKHRASCTSTGVRPTSTGARWVLFGSASHGLRREKSNALLVFATITVDTTTATRPRPRPRPRQRPSPPKTCCWLLIYL
jgi:hypothetical protein